MPCELPRILEIGARRPAHRRRRRVRRSAARFVHCRWEKIGKPHADVACFSFHPRKLLSTGDGGMLTTASAEFDRKLPPLRQHGHEHPPTPHATRRRRSFSSRIQIVGFNTA
jgi:dTDP-4-amino-4,6-dideoxygalactose transaminase